MGAVVVTKRKKIGKKRRRGVARYKARWHFGGGGRFHGTRPLAIVVTLVCSLVSVCRIS